MESPYKQVNGCAHTVLAGTDFLTTRDTQTGGSSPDPWVIHLPIPCPMCILLPKNHIAVLHLHPKAGNIVILRSRAAKKATWKLQCQTALGNEWQDIHCRWESSSRGLHQVQLHIAREAATQGSNNSISPWIKLFELPYHERLVGLVVWGVMFCLLVCLKANSNGIQPVFPLISALKGFLSLQISQYKR